ncbi:MAG: choice-of-anchor Q domain-containing protein, partial [Tepidisphaeraceae bacterium]
NGGAIDSNSGSVSVQGCTFSDNVVTQDGGAIEADFAILNIVNSTFAANSAGDSGGAIESNAATTTITNATISTNNAVNGGGGIDIQPGGDTSLYNTIVSGNTLADGVTPSDLSGPLDESLQSGQAASSNNLITVAGLGLGALANNGGPTQTMALLPGSPAIDAGDDALALDVNGNPLTTDQRGVGFPRIVGAAVDIGAYEAPLPAPAVSAFTNLTAPMTITAGTPSVTVGGVISAGSIFPASGEVVDVTLNGVTQDATIGSNGVFSTTFNTSSLPASATPYPVMYSYAGDTKLSAASDAPVTTITVKAPATAGTATLTVSPVTGTAGDKITLSATLLGTASAPLAHQVVVFTLDGKVVAKKETNSKGVACACVRLRGIAPGTYASGVVASYAGNKNYAAVTATAALTVADSEIKASGLCLSLCNGKAELLAGFDQPGDFALATDYTVTINWGDGSTPDTGKVLGPYFCGNVFAVKDTHTYAASKTKTTTYTVTVTITSKYGATKTLTEKVKS